MGKFTVTCLMNTAREWPRSSRSGWHPSQRLRRSRLVHIDLEPAAPRTDRGSTPPPAPIKKAILADFHDGSMTLSRDCTPCSAQDRFCSWIESEWRRYYRRSQSTFTRSVLAKIIAASILFPMRCRSVGCEIPLIGDNELTPKIVIYLHGLQVLEESA